MDWATNLEQLEKKSYQNHSSFIIVISYFETSLSKI